MHAFLHYTVCASCIVKFRVSTPQRFFDRQYVHYLNIALKANVLDGRAEREREREREREKRQREREILLTSKK